MNERCIHVVISSCVGRMREEKSDGLTEIIIVIDVQVDSRPKQSLGSVAAPALLLEEEVESTMRLGKDDREESEFDDKTCKEQ